MDLIATATKPTRWSRALISLKTYRPLIIVFTIITIVSSVVALGNATQHYAIDIFMMTFMASFFIVFGGLKLLDLQGFVASFRSYDLIARHSKQYAYAYPFIELLVGLMYAANAFVVASNLATLVLTAVGIAGVAMKLRKHETVQCACLGTFLKIPLTKVTLIENLAMFVMAAFMLQGISLTPWQGLSNDPTSKPANNRTMQQSTTMPSMHMDMRQ
jgi:hypothetical protein